MHSPHRSLLATLFYGKRGSVQTRFLETQPCLDQEQASGALNGLLPPNDAQGITLCPLVVPMVAVLSPAKKLYLPYLLARFYPSVVRTPYKAFCVI